MKMRMAVVGLVGVMNLVGCRARTETNVVAPTSMPSAVEEFSARQPAHFYSGTVEAALLGASGAMAAAANATTMCPQLKWINDSGKYSIWRAQRPVSVIVTLTRNGRVVGSTINNMRTNDQIVMLMWDGQNGDGFHSCTDTL